MIPYGYEVWTLVSKKTMHMVGVQVAGTIMCWWYSRAMYLWGVVSCDNTCEPPFFILKKKSRASLKIVELLVFFLLIALRVCLDRTYFAETEN